MAKKKEKTVIKGNWEDVIKASVKGNPKPKPKKKSKKEKIIVVSQKEKI